MAKCGHTEVLFKIARPKDREDSHAIKMTRNENSPKMIRLTLCITFSWTGNRGHLFQLVTANVDSLRECGRIIIVQ